MGRQYGMTKVDDFNRWLAAAKPGDVLTYHVGHNVIGLGIGGAAWKAAVKGEVLLFQKRLTKGSDERSGTFEYRALRVTEQLGKRMRPVAHGGVWS
jgi:hypothetical protein